MKIIIRDKNPQGGLAFDLLEVLGGIQGVGESLHWRVLHLDAIAHPVGASLVAAASSEARRNPTGNPISWPELQALARSIFQTIDAEFVGLATESEGEGPLIQIIAEDSSFWEVNVQDDQLGRRVAETFDDVEVT